MNGYRIPVKAGVVKKSFLFLERLFWKIHQVSNIPAFIKRFLIFQDIKYFNGNTLANKFFGIGITYNPL